MPNSWLFNTVIKVSTIYVAMPARIMHVYATIHPCPQVQILLIFNCGEIRNCTRRIVPKPVLGANSSRWTIFSHLPRGLFLQVLGKSICQICKKEWKFRSPLWQRKTLYFNEVREFPNRICIFFLHDRPCLRNMADWPKPCKANSILAVIRLLWPIYGNWQHNNIVSVVKVQAVFFSYQNCIQMHWLHS